MDHHAPAAQGPDAENTGTRSILDAATQALTRIVHTYAPGRTAAFRPDHWRGLQPYPYTLHRVRDALAACACHDLERTATKIATEAIALSPELLGATMTACGGARKGVSWIKSSAPPATKPAVLISAYRLLAEASAADDNLRRRGLLNTLYAVRAT
ncbi:hypothetical protein [Actinomadura spongiicola]|uniref:hypothetical protein n=1 Tax=Actinomadura spongiicola TaxID=2303421 RepID=UPI0011C142DC|nr:hypothetical protein [Actinomadura spongiicola]